MKNKYDIGELVEFTQRFDETIQKGHIGGIQRTQIKNDINYYYGIIPYQEWSEEGKKEFDNKYSNEWEYFWNEEHPVSRLVWIPESYINKVIKYATFLY